MHLIDAELQGLVKVQLRLQVIEMILPRTNLRQLDDLAAGIHLEPLLNCFLDVSPCWQPCLQQHRA
jgi:hypothetical protein